MRVLHVITGLNVGGAETMLARLLEQRRRAPDLRPEVVSLMPPGRMAARIAATGTGIHDLGMSAGLPSPLGLIRLARLLHARRPRVVMAWMHHAQLATTLAASLGLTRAPVIWNVRHSLNGFADEKALTRAVLQAQALLSGRPRSILYNSYAAAEQYRAFGFRAADQRVVPNGFDVTPLPPREAHATTLRDRFGIPDGRLVIGMVARSAPMKDAPNLVAACAAALRRGLPAHLLLVGEGMDRPDPSLRLALSAIPADRVTCSGHRGDVAEWLGGLDLLALPSAWGEGFPNIVGEAMLNAVPCVCTDVGDARLLVGDTGRIVPPRTSGALAEALVELGSMAVAARRALGLRARRRIEERYDIAAVADSYATLLREAAVVPSAAFATGPSGSPA